MYIIHVRELSRVLATSDSLIHTTHASKKENSKTRNEERAKQVLRLLFSQLAYLVVLLHNKFYSYYNTYKMKAAA